MFCCKRRPEYKDLFFLNCNKLVNFPVIFVGFTKGLQEVRISSSPYARLGEDAPLLCDFQLDSNETLYAVKWYYGGSQEFYRYVPKEVPPQRVFHLGSHVSLNVGGLS